MQYFNKTYQTLRLQSSVRQLYSPLFRQPVIAMQHRQFAHWTNEENKKNANRINEIPLKEYFEEFLRRRPMNKSGYIDLSKPNFTKMVKKIKTEDDFAVIKDAHIQWIGHRNLLDQK